MFYAKDSKGNFVVFELKKGRKNDEVIYYLHEQAFSNISPHYRSVSCIHNRTGGSIFHFIEHFNGIWSTRDR